MFLFQKHFKFFQYLRLTLPFSHLQHVKEVSKYPKPNSEKQLATRLVSSEFSQSVFPKTFSDAQIMSKNIFCSLPYTSNQIHKIKKKRPFRKKVQYKKTVLLWEMINATFNFQNRIPQSRTRWKRPHATKYTKYNVLRSLQQLLIKRLRATNEGHPPPQSGL